LNQTLVTEEDIVYDSYSNIESRKIKNSKQKINETRYLYPYHFTSETIYAMMVGKSMTSLPIQIEQYLDASLQQTIKIDYSQFGSNVIAPSIEKIKYQGQSVFENKRKFNAYDDYGNIREIEHSNGIKEVYIWGFSGKIPVATIVGTSYNSIAGLLDYNIINWPDGMSQLETHLNSLKPSLGVLSRMKYSIPDYALNTVKAVDENGHSTQYRYDVHDRLALVLDKDNRIIKQNCYSYNGDVSDCITTAMWSSTGLNRCKPCALNNNYSTNIQETEEVDFNPFSNTYNTSRWVETGTSSSCIVSPDWQNTVSALRCKKNASNQNTGEQEQEQRDMNPCSSTYNQTRWVVVSTNVQACPTSTNVTILCNNTVSGGTIYMQYHNINTGQIYNFNTTSTGYNISLGTIPAGPYNIMIGSSHYNTPLYYSVACGFYFNGVSAVFNNVNVDNTCRTVTISPY
jgi:YD repeat-containing protein